MTLYYEINGWGRTYEKKVEPGDVLDWICERCGLKPTHEQYDFAEKVIDCLDIPDCIEDMYIKPAEDDFRDFMEERYKWEAREKLGL